MYDFNKPDLFVHPFYYDLVKSNFDLDLSFNLCSLTDIQTEEVIASYVTDSSVRKVRVFVDPLYSDRLIAESGGDPAKTSYWLGGITQMYRVTNTAPRYVIWTKEHNLTLCCTRLDRVHSYQLYLAVQRAKEWAYTVTNSKSIAVFDLDDTLIDARDEVLDGAHEVLEYVRKRYDYLVLWSHGSPLHVDEQLEKFDSSVFDLVLRNDGNPVNKNLLHLYNYFHECRFARALLVDDTVCNWTPEYTNMIVPSRDIKSLRQMLKVL